MGINYTCQYPALGVLLAVRYFLQKLSDLADWPGHGFVGEFDRPWESPLSYGIPKGTRRQTAQQK